MAGRFSVPCDSEFLEAFGVEPAMEHEESDAFGVLIQGVSELPDVFRVTWSAVDASIRIRWIRDGVALVDIYRETATRLSIREERGEVHLDAVFAGDGYRSEISMQVMPYGCIRDRLLSS